MAKRTFDLVLSLAVLAVLVPVFVILAIWIKADSRGPVLFRQLRVGLGGVPFRILKFRTMRADAEPRGNLTLGNDSRITRAGHFLRRYKLDELPQLLNVVVGEMSLVGPRPEVEDYINFYCPDARRAMLSLRPGVTGPSLWALFNEGELLSLSEDPYRTYTSELIPIKGEDAMRYAANNSLWVDTKIIFRTLRMVLRGRR
jgi:lipopolysaccharide/colanic/teichoic acid biosynthesis glycosyltransferase